MNLSGLLEDLHQESYSEFLEKARLLGNSVKKDWYAQATNEKDKFTSNRNFKEFLIKKMARIPLPVENRFDEIKALKTKLSHLQLFLAVWDDADLSREENKQIRPQVKYKAKLDKDDRHAVKIALLALAFTLSEQTDEWILSQEANKANASQVTHEQRADIRVTSFKEITTTEALNDLISKCIRELIRRESRFTLKTYIDKLSKHDAIKYKDLIDELSKKNDRLKQLDEIRKKPALAQKIAKIAKAISSFDTPTKKKKTLKYLGIFIAWIASLAAGISTGGAVYLLFPTLVIPAITVGVFIFAVGYIANFRFFSQNLPNFLLSLAKKGGATEFINREGKREQLSRLKKYLLLPLALLASLTVGISGAALTYTAILSLVSSILPMLAMLWPPLPIVLVGILAVSVLIVLSVSTFNAIIEMFKKPLPSLAALRETFSIEKIRQLGARQIIACIMQALLIPVALFGLVYFRIIAGVDLSTLTGLVSAVISGVAALIAQIAFTVLSINKLNKALMHPFASSTQAGNLADTSRKGWFSRIKSTLAWIYAPVCLISNAVGNAALVYNGSPLSTAGAVACGLNSLAGNIPEQDMNQIKRVEATTAIVNKLYTLEQNLNDATEENSNILKGAGANSPSSKKGLSSDILAYPNNSQPSGSNSASFFPSTQRVDNDKHGGLSKSKSHLSLACDLNDYPLRSVPCEADLLSPQQSTWQIDEPHGLSKSKSQPSLVAAR
jgi:hypothetical protein